MKFLFVAACAAALAALLPYIRCFFKRLACRRKIVSLCRRKNYVLHASHPFCFLGWKYAPRCDFYIETPGEVFAVKLFGMPGRLTVLILKENGGYSIRRFLPFAPYGGFAIDGGTKPMPAYDFRYRYRDEWEIKTPRRVLLVNPVSMEFRRRPAHGDEVIVGAGEIVNGMEIDSLPRLLGDLEGAL